MRPIQLVLLSILLSSGTASLARAEEGPSLSIIQASVEERFVAPLSRWQERRSRFSRARIAPEARRLRMTAPALQRDGRGEDFAAFAVDVRFRGSKEWGEALAGCIYPASGGIFVQYGDRYVAGALLYGKKSPDAPEGVCRTGDLHAARDVAPPQLARNAALAKPAARQASRL
jgi:hypothetical protein